MNIRVFKRVPDTLHDYTYQDIFGLRELNIDFDKNTVQIKNAQGQMLSLELTELAPSDLLPEVTNDFLFAYDNLPYGDEIVETVDEENNIKVVNRPALIESIDNPPEPEPVVRPTPKSEEVRPTNRPVVR